MKHTSGIWDESRDEKSEGGTYLQELIDPLPSLQVSQTMIRSKR